VLGREVGHRVDRVEVAVVDAAGRRPHDRRLPAQGLQQAVELGKVDAARRVRHEAVHVVRAEPGHRHRFLGARMEVAAREHRHGGDPREAGALDVEPVLLACPVARGGRSGEVGHRRAGREHAAPAGGQLEEIEEPRERDLLEPRPERGGHPDAVVLVEHRGEPIGGEGRRRAAADDEVEETRAGGAGRGGQLLEQLVEGGDRAVAAFRE
jgi:hypothetical protein